MLDLLIKNAEIIDGTGKARYTADLGVAEQRIVLISENITQEARQTIQADGLILSPGFIDPHAHSDLIVFGNQRAESFIHQGVTTQVVGNCGLSAAPLADGSLGDLKALSSGIEFETLWTNVAEYLAQVQKTGISLNMVPLVGHSNIRGSVLGYDNVQPSPQQQVAMETLVAEAMEQGARGLSTGLYYAPGYFAKTDEVIGLAKTAARYGGIYTSHIRSESDLVLEALDEAIEIGRQAQIPVQYSHVKICGFRNWELIDDLVARLEGPSARDIQLCCDQYPYTACSTLLSSILPYWILEGNGKVVAQRMHDPLVREKLRQDWIEHRVDWDNLSGVRDWDDILITICASRPELAGKNIAEIAALDKIDPFDAALNLIALDDAQAAAVYFDQDDGVLKKLMALPYVAVGSDSQGGAPYGILAERSLHPRGYGTFPRVLGHYVREEKVISLEEAVRKMTSLCAQQYNLLDRGVIRVGAWADLVLFDAGVVADQATFFEPQQYPLGIPYVIVNGQIVINQGEHNGSLPGRVL